MKVFETSNANRALTSDGIKVTLRTNKLSTDLPFVTTDGKIRVEIKDYNQYKSY